MKIRTATESDSEEIWKIFRAVVRPGDTYALDPNISRADALAYWSAAGTQTFVAEDESGGIVGTYILRPNQQGPGAHVANAAFMVSPNAQGRGVGRVIGEHCLTRARELGFRAMQFNFVVSTNTAAVKLWQQLGFEIVGRLPGAFNHPRDGYVDAYVMFRDFSAD